LIQYDQFVAERVANTRAPTDCNIKGRLEGLSARAQEACESLVDIVH
jgi:hypothetical protein